MCGLEDPFSTFPQIGLWYSSEYDCSIPAPFPEAARRPCQTRSSSLKGFTVKVMSVYLPYPESTVSSSRPIHTLSWLYLQLILCQLLLYCVHSFHKIFLTAIKGAAHWESRQVLMTTTGTRSGNSHFNSGTLHRCNVLILDVSSRLITSQSVLCVSCDMLL